MITRRRPRGTRASPARARITDWPRRWPPSITTQLTPRAAFVSVIRNQTPSDQLRLTAQFRNDFFQIPYDPSQTDYEATSGYYSSFGLRDGQTERDGFLIANWVHTFSPKALLSVAPFYHYNQSNYDSPCQRSARGDHVAPDVELWRRAGRLPRRVSVTTISPPGCTRSMRGENDLFGALINDGSAPRSPNTSANANAGLVEFYVSDHLHVGRYITLIGGERFSIYRAGIERDGNLSAHRRDGRDSPAALGSARLLRALLPARAGRNGFASRCSIMPRNLPSGENTFTPAALRSAMRNTSSASRFRSRAGCWMLPTSRTASTTSSITPTWANRICISPSPSMARWCAPGR